MQSSERYDAIRYPGRVYEFTHPDRLATIARLHGIGAPEVETARVLEIGCGDGTNLLGIAASLPHAHLLGIDRCADPLSGARSAAADLDLHHVEALIAQQLRGPGARKNAREIGHSIGTHPRGLTLRGRAG